MGSPGRPNLSYAACRSGPVLDTLSYLILSCLILDILEIFVILGYLRPQESGQTRRSGAKRSPKGIPSKRASGTDFVPNLIDFSMDFG